MIFRGYVSFPGSNVEAVSTNYFSSSVPFYGEPGPVKISGTPRIGGDLPYTSTISHSNVNKYEANHGNGSPIFWGVCVGI